ncbi:MAG: hypothetical protein ACP5UA_07115 [Candidatus Hydrogenedens sp.]
MDKKELGSKTAKGGDLPMKKGYVRNSIPGQKIKKRKNGFK